MSEAEMTYTPGPWVSVDGVLPPDDEGHARSFIRPVHNEGYQIAQTVGPNGPGNGRLLAAAPKMLAALVLIDKTFSRLQASEDELRAFAALDAAVADATCTHSPDMSAAP